MKKECKQEKGKFGNGECELVMMKIPFHFHFLVRSCQFRCSWLMNNSATLQKSTLNRAS